MDAPGTEALARISAAVLLGAASVTPASDSEATARLLYHGNWLPLTPDWLTRFPDDEAVTRFAVSDAAARALSSRWLRSHDASWTYWRSSGGGGAADPYKVYVSVLPDELPVTFEACVAVLAQCGARSFKFVRHPRGLLRPDRLVVYCPSRGATEDLVLALADALGGHAAQGVPFTSATPASMAVSWARDPSPAAAAYAPSWRRWVTRKLAGYLHSSDAIDAVGRSAFALARLSDDGVDTDAWAPGPRLWETR